MLGSDGKESCTSPHKWGSSEMGSPTLKLAAAKVSDPHAVSASVFAAIRLRAEFVYPLVCKVPGTRPDSRTRRCDLDLDPPPTPIEILIYGVVGDPVHTPHLSR